MTASNYDECISRVLKSEGGYVDNPRDPGGETNFGITKSVARANGYLANMRAMPVATAKAIYRARYWNAVRGDRLPVGLDYTVFDYAVNSGVGRAAKVLAKAVGLTSSTVSDAVVAAVSKRDPEKLIEAINSERLRFMKGLSTWGTFGRGWSSRVASVKSVSLRMADAGRAPPPAATDPLASSEPAAKAVVPSPTGAKGVAVGASAVAAAAAGKNGWTWIAAHPAETGVLVIVACGLVAVIVRGLDTAHADAKDEPHPSLQTVPELPKAA